MSEDRPNSAPHHVPLTVLPSSGKVEELKRELQESLDASLTPPARASAPVIKEAGAGDAPTQNPPQRDIQRKEGGVLRTGYDPEIPVNIFALGLIYEVRVDEADGVLVKRTLTAPACPVAGSLPGE